MPNTWILNSSDGYILKTFEGFHYQNNVQNEQKPFDYANASNPICVSDCYKANGVQRFNVYKFFINYFTYS